MMNKPNNKDKAIQTEKINQKMQELYQQLKTQGLKSAEINTKMIKLLIQELSKWQ